MKKHFLTVLFSIAAFAVYSQNKIEKIDLLLKTYTSYDALNGSILIAENGKVVYKKGFGKANFEWNIDNTPETKFEIASMSKLFTAVIILQLVEAGKLTLEGKISDYLPDYPKDKGQKITIQQLLTHTSGITDTRFIKNFDNEYGMESRPHAGFINLFKDEKLLFEPGTSFSYSNFGYNLLAYIAESVTGKSFSDLLQEKIFGVAGMENSSTLEDPLVAGKTASGYEMRFSDIQKAHYHDPSASFGSGSVLITVSDYFLFQEALTDGKLLSKKYLQILFTPVTKASGELTGYSLWYDKLALNKADTITIIRSAGSHFGVNTVGYSATKNDMQLLMFLNVKNPRMFEIADNVTNILYGLPVEEPKDSYAHIFNIDVQKNSVAYALGHYENLKKKNAGTLVFRDFNRLGYFYMDKGRFDAAIEVFKLNITAFPQNAGGYDSLGEAYMKTGNKQLAIKNYQRSVELDPNNANAAEMIIRLNDKK